MARIEDKYFKYSYTICNSFSEKYFELQCKAIENHIPGLVKFDYLQDVDGSQIREYRYEKEFIRVQNDYPIGAVWVDSTFALEPYFKQSK